MQDKSGDKKDLETVQSRVERILRIVAETIAHETSHAYLKHHKNSNEFNDPAFGPPLGIHSAVDLQHHAAAVFASEETMTINPRGTALFAYHPPSETVVILNAYGRMKKDGGTIYRRVPDEKTVERSWYERLIELEAERMGVSSFPVLSGGLVARLKTDKSFAALLDQRYSGLHAAKNTPPQHAGNIDVHNGKGGSRQSVPD